MTPRESVERECTRRGRDAVVDGCIALASGDRSDAALIEVLGGPGGRAFVSGDPGWADHWTRVWAARGLLHVWDDRAAPAIVALLEDDAWRVREMAAKVCARHRVDDALPRLVELRGADPAPRVRTAAARAVVRIASG